MSHRLAQYESSRAHRLYSELQPQLVRILASNLQAPEWVIDDACQTAWSSLLTRGPTATAGGELGWLSTTATRAALRLLRRECAEPDPQAALASPVRPRDSRAAEPGPDHDLELRERLAEVRRLPTRQQRIVMLHGFGYEYREIAAVTGQTPRTVARQLTRARQRLLRPVEE